VPGQQQSQVLLYQSAPAPHTDPISMAVYVQQDVFVSFYPENKILFAVMCDQFTSDYIIALQQLRTSTRGNS
jgi:hypothetical protein